jgi:hypothetical protein
MTPAGVLSISFHDFAVLREINSPAQRLTYRGWDLGIEKGISPKGKDRTMFLRVLKKIRSALLLIFRENATALKAIFKPSKGKLNP